ncbi:MAG: hotdog domain-containing protein [Candidatus Binatia bacterium]|nr:hotdog domain-containing protein [Candidatus Binatia bacterium]
MHPDLQTLAEATPAPSAPLQRIADALKRLARFVLSTRDEGTILEPIAAELERVCAALPEASKPQGGKRQATRFHPEDLPKPNARLVNARGTHPLVGTVNPVAPPIDLHARDYQVLGDVEFDLRFEGNVGWVHGGFVAAGFDIVLVAAGRLSGHAGPTGTLQVRFEKPTPVGKALRYVAWFEKMEGRKIFVRAELRPREGEEVLAQASAVLIRFS